MHRSAPKCSPAGAGLTLADTTRARLRTCNGKATLSPPPLGLMPVDPLTAETSLLMLSPALVDAPQRTQVQSCWSGSNACRYHASAASYLQWERNAFATATDGLNGVRGSRDSPGESKRNHG